MRIIINADRGRKVADLLFRAFSTSGIHGQMEMPEDTMPKGVRKGSLDHVLFITLTVSIDYQRNAIALWEASRRTFEDAKTRYVFSPQALHEMKYDALVQDMQKYGLSKKPKRDASIWRTIGITLYKKWGGDPRNFLADCQWNAPLILDRLKLDTHANFGRGVSDYPYLRGDKIGPLWVRMLRDNVGLTEIQNLKQVPIPVDIHVARASLALGVVRGNYKGQLNGIFGDIREAWAESVQGLTAASRPMIALDVDEPLWHLSKYGCTNRDKITGDCPVISQCELREFCWPGKIAIEGALVDLNT